jgi:hypothetical protein
MRGYSTMSDEEKNSILQQHSAFYNGYATGNIPSGPQPLLQDEGPTDSQGITVNNRGEVGQYRNHLVNESVVNEEEVKEYAADDMDVSDVEAAYDFESGGPDQFGDEDMTYSEDSHGMDIDSIMSMFDGSITADYDDEVPAYQFDSEGAMDVDLYEGADEDGDGEISKGELHKHFDEDGDGKVTPDEYDSHIKSHIEEKETCEQCGSEMTEGECQECGSMYEEVDEDLRESFIEDRERINEMFDRFKKFL